MFNRLLLGCLIATALSSACSADKLFVRNRAYSGYLTGSARDLQSLEVDIVELCQALGFQLEERDGNWIVNSGPSGLPANGHKLYVGDQEIKFREQDHRKLVSLSDVATALGARLVRHPEVGTIDLNLVAPREVGFNPNKSHLIYYGADWAPAAKLFKPVIVEVDLRKIVPVIYVDRTQPRSANYKNFIRYFNGDKIPYTVLLAPKGKVIKTWTGYHDLGPFATELQKLLNGP